MFVLVDYRNLGIGIRIKMRVSVTSEDSMFDLSVCLLELLV